MQASIFSSTMNDLSYSHLIVHVGVWGILTPRPDKISSQNHSSLPSFPPLLSRSLSSAIVACWMVYPALTADFKKSVGLPYDPKDLAA